MKEQDIPPLKDENPVSTWVVSPLQAKLLSLSLEENGFKKLQIDGKNPKVWNDEYEWYYDETGNVVTIDYNTRRSNTIITVTEGCIPVVADAFGGMDKLRKATDNDF